MQTGPHRVAEKDAADVVDEEKGKVTICPRRFNITWGNDDRYWCITDSNETGNSRNSSVAELKQVSWLEVICSTDNVELGKKYKVGFNVSLRPDAFGWNGVAVYVMAKIGKSGQFFPMKVSLGDEQSNQKLTIPKTPLEITVDEPNQRSIHFGLYEVWSSKWKGGLLIYDAFIEKVD